MKMPYALSKHLLAGIFLLMVSFFSVSDSCKAGELMPFERFDQMPQEHKAVYLLCEVESGAKANTAASEDGAPPELDREIPDPLEPVNRFFFEFNDRLYFYILKPAARGYKWIIPEPIRISIKNFFKNLLMPVRAANCLLQGKPRSFANEIGRFFINSTAGVAGFADPATTALKMEEHEEDLGQTFGHYGIGPGLFINWPLLGPSSLRDTIGSVGESFLNPISYVDTTKYVIAIRGTKLVNNTSLRLGQYEALKESSFDPYTALRNAYHQNRNYEIKK